MSSEHFLRRGRRYGLNEFGSTATILHPTVVAWAAQVVTNGGAAPSWATKSALDTFIRGLDTDGLTALMKSVCCMVPDSLVAAITPLIATYGNKLWINHGFVSGDLTIAGLVGASASSKYLDTGVNPTAAFADNNSMGFTVYVSVNVNESTCDIGAYSGSALTDGIYCSSASAAYFYAHNQTGGTINGANSTFSGYLSANRTNATSSAIYKAKASTGQLTVASSTTQSSIGTRTNVPFYAFAAYSYASGGPIYPTNRRYSFMAIHEGLSSAQSAAFYTRIQALRTALGGGYV